MTSHQDVLLSRLRRLKKDDLMEILVGGLKVSAESVINRDKQELINLCSKELRGAAGSSTANVFRGDHEFPYKQILIDVADKLSPGHTILSWTDYKLGDDHTEAEIENTISNLFEERTKKWWKNLSPEKKAEFVGGLNSAMERSDEVKKITNSGALGSFVTQQMIENIIQTGIMSGLGKVAAGGALGTLGVSVIAQIGWLIVLQTVGWMSGVKFLLFGAAGHGAMGGAVSTVGGLAVGGVLSIPTLFALADGAAYRKTVPTIILLITKYRLASSSRQIEVM
jgi:uncharacterized protein YaaW (UPF0174 family)